MSITGLDIRPINRVSPSQYSILTECPYKVLLSRACDSELLPYPPSAHFGIVAHECIRLILTNQVQTEDEFNERWKALIAYEEEKLSKEGFDFYVPLKAHVKQYSIRKLQVKALLGRKKPAQSATIAIKTQYLHEELLVSRDRTLSGRADLICIDDGYVKLVDYKTGQIQNEHGEIAEHIKIQLKLYAYLYNERFERYPDELVVIDLNRNSHTIPFEPKECAEIAREALDLLLSINNLVQASKYEELANPSTENCNHCLYRPACIFHWTNDYSEQEYIDIRGTLQDSRVFTNGSINMNLRNADHTVTVSSLKRSMVESLLGTKGAEIAFFNVRRTTNPEWFIATTITVVYEQ